MATFSFLDITYNNPFITLKHMKIFTVISLSPCLNWMLPLESCSSSAPGHDRISFDMIKQIAPLVRSYLLVLWSSLEMGPFSRFFVSSHCYWYSIPQPGKGQSVLMNHWTISLTSCLCKLLEKVLNARMTWFLRKNRALTLTQCGSQAGRSTLDPLACLKDTVRRGLSVNYWLWMSFLTFRKSMILFGATLWSKCYMIEGLRVNFPCTVPSEFPYWQNLPSTCRIFLLWYFSLTWWDSTRKCLELHPLCTRDQQ